MRRLLLALACISLVQSCSASPTSGEARPSSTTGFRTAASSALSSRPTPVTPSHQGDLHHESFSRTPAQATLDEGEGSSMSSGNNPGGSTANSSIGVLGSLEGWPLANIDERRRSPKTERDATALSRAFVTAYVSRAGFEGMSESFPCICYLQAAHKGLLLVPMRVIRDEADMIMKADKKVPGLSQHQRVVPSDSHNDGNDEATTLGIVVPAGPALSLLRAVIPPGGARIQCALNRKVKRHLPRKKSLHKKILRLPWRVGGPRGLSRSHAWQYTTHQSMRSCPLPPFIQVKITISMLSRTKCQLKRTHSHLPTSRLTPLWNPEAMQYVNAYFQMCCESSPHKTKSMLVFARPIVPVGLENMLSLEPEPSSSVARDFFTLTPEGLVSNAERLAARSGYGGAGAFSSCAEKHSPYALDGYCLPEILVSPKNSVRQHMIVIPETSSSGEVYLYCVPDYISRPAFVPQRGKALIELAGTAIADELRQARILTRSQAQLRQSCIELLCYPKERLLRNAERALYEAYRKGLMRSGMCLTDDLMISGAETRCRYCYRFCDLPTAVDPSEEEDTSEEEVDEEELAANSVESCRPGSLPWLLSREGTRWSTRIVKEHSAAWRLTSSELDYAYIRFYEYAADYNFAVVTCEFLFGLRPEPRKGFPGEQYLASPPVLRMLSSADGSPLMERKKLSLLSYQLEHITFMRQLLREKRLILADVFVTPCPEFPTFNSSNICSERLRRRRNRHASRLD
ncbi:hypothetical protein ACSSS7_002526 [Eimeria intestinalis]